MEEKFGTAGAEAFAFACGFQRKQRYIIRKSADGQRPEVQTFSVVTVNP